MTDIDVESLRAMQDIIASIIRKAGARAAVSPEAVETLELAERLEALVEAMLARQISDV